MRKAKPESIIRLRCGSNGVSITFELHQVGRDMLGVLTGGEAHVGACALGSLSETGNVSVRTLTVAHHRETEIVRALAGEISRTFRCSCVVAGGIHFERITRRNILKILKLVDVLRGKIRKLKRGVQDE